MQLLHIKFAALAHAAPQDRAPFMMHLEHVSFRFFTRIAEDALENHRHIAHQIHGIVVHDDLPWKVKFFFGTSLFLDGGLINCRRSRIFPNMERGDRCAFIHRHLLAKVAPHSYSKRLTYVTFSSNVWMRLRSSVSTSLHSRL